LISKSPVKTRTGKEILVATSAKLDMRQKKVVV